MKNIIKSIWRALRSLIPDTKSNSIEDEVLTLKKLIEETSIGETTPNAVSDGYMTGGKFEKVIDQNVIVIKNAREYVKITPSILQYGYQSKYNPDSDKHHLEISRNPWEYIDEKSNVTPGMAINFLKRYLERLRNKAA